ncbi:beta-lactamase [Chondrocystis sp. NIES-4102]|nr:beta-lactamase [Chondrocystis sp. NIES-4102]
MLSGKSYIFDTIYSHWIYKTILRVIFSLLILCVSQIYFMQGALAQSNPDQISIEAKELENFLDQYFQEEMEQMHIPGAAIAIVKDGKTLLTKGYGYADLEKKIPVTADKTLFRVGSVSKLFTATAMMQLVDRGLINLEDNVNQYLNDFQIKEDYLQPIRIANILTHTSGFSQQEIGIAARNEAEILPLKEYLIKRQPPRVRPPGILYSYNNYEANLAGHIIETVSGVPFAQYIESNILQPLGMKRSTFAQPLQDNLAAALAVGYEYENGKYKSLPFLYLNIVPAGAMSATATDMTHFMLAHLQNGLYQEQRILSETSAQAMQAQQFSDRPQLPGVGYGFHERFKQEQRILAHSAIFYGYTGLLALIPQQNLGLFIAYNKFEPEFHEQLINRFIDHYYPAAATPQPQPLKNFQQRSNRFVGTYRNLEYSNHTISKISSLLKQVSVSKNQDGFLNVDFLDGFFATKPAQENTTNLVEVKPLLFYRQNDDDYVAFANDQRDRITYMFHPLDLGPAAFERLNWTETIKFQIVLLGFFIITFLSAIARSISRLSKKRTHTNSWARWAWLVAGLVATISLIFPIGLVVTLWLIGFEEIIYGMPKIAIAWFYLPLIASGLTISLPIFSIFALQSRHWSIGQKLHYLVIAIAGLGFIWFLNYWNFLGFKF